jgi:hypothetical protein|nr:hypothetical protein [uncultured Prevotella sp.]
MKKCYYYVATIFDSNPSGVIDGVLSTKDEHFPVAEQMRFLAEQRGISPTNVVITFFAEVSETEYDNYKRIVDKKG